MMTTAEKVSLINSTIDTLNAVIDLKLKCDHEAEHYLRPCGDTGCVYCMCLESKNDQRRLREEQ